MSNLPYRTCQTSLTDSELILLDQLFMQGCGFGGLRDSVFQRNWNLPYSHNLDDETLRVSLTSLCKRQILALLETEGRPFYAMTAKGGEIWSQERCPVWDRFCCEWYQRTTRDRTIMKVVAVSPKIRDDFLCYWPMYPARRKTTRIDDFGLIPWHPFDGLHVGLAVYRKERQWTPDEYKLHTARQEAYFSKLEDNRSWWRCVSELQLFVPE